jgi:hypothetical protein
MTTVSNHDTSVLPAVRRAVVGISAESWGVHPWDFKPVVRAVATRVAREMSDEEHCALRAANRLHMQTFYRVLDAVEEMTGERDIVSAHLIVAMYRALAL